MKAAFLALLCVAAIALSEGRIMAFDDPTPKPTPSDWFECPGDGAYANPYNCRKYFVCISDTAWGMTCPARLYFNAAKGVCDTKMHANCKEVVTTPGTMV